MMNNRCDLSAKYNRRLMSYFLMSSIGQVTINFFKIILVDRIARKRFMRFVQAQSDKNNARLNDYHIISTFDVFFDNCRQFIYFDFCLNNIYFLVVHVLFTAKYLFLLHEDFFILFLKICFYYYRAFIENPDEFHLNNVKLFEDLDEKCG